MTTPQQSDDDIYGTWEHIGRAAEDFARRVARDAGKFAERMEEHAGEFAHDIRRDWQRLQRDYRHGHRHAHHRTSAPDVRRIFEDIRTIVADVLDGVDELIDRVFTGRSDAPADDWARIVNNRDITCGQCARTIAAGEESYARHTAGATEFRCTDCGVPGPA
jgi:hypothetical protein